MKCELKNRDYEFYFLLNKLWTAEVPATLREIIVHLPTPVSFGWTLSTHIFSYLTLQQFNNDEVLIEEFLLYSFPIVKSRSKLFT